MLKSMNTKIVGSLTECVSEKERKKTTNNKLHSSQFYNPYLL